VLELCHCDRCFGLVNGNPHVEGVDLEVGILKGPDEEHVMVQNVRELYKFQKWNPIYELMPL